MNKEKKPLFSDEFLDVLIEEINHQYSSPFQIQMKNFQLMKMNHNIYKKGTNLLRFYALLTCPFFHIFLTNYRQSLL